MGDKVEKEIKGHLEVLVGEIGPRATGSSNNFKAIEYIENELVGTGFSVERQEFDCINWTPGKARLIIQGKEVLVRGADYTLPCKIEGKITCIENLRQLEEGNLDGEIAFLWGEIASEPLMPKNFPFWNPPEHKKIISLLEEKRPKGVLFSSCSEESLVPLIEDGDFSIPCGVVPPGEESFILEKKGKVAQLEIEATRSPAWGANLIARTEGSLPKIALTAHLDTKPFTPGALDNAVGIATLLTLGKLLMSKKPGVQVELVALNGEDYFSNPGEVIYFKENLLQTGKYRFGINVDGIGYKEGETGVSFFEFPSDLKDKIRAVKKGFPDIVEINPWPQGDHMLFVLKGIPALALTSTEVFGILNKIIHTSEDGIDLIDFKKVSSVVAFLFGLISKL